MPLRRTRENVLFCLNLRSEEGGQVWTEDQSGKGTYVSKSALAHASATATLDTQPENSKQGDQHKNGVNPAGTGARRSAAIQNRLVRPRKYSRNRDDWNLRDGDEALDNIAAVKPVV